MRYNSCIKVNGRWPLMEERESDPARGQMARKARLWEREREKRPSKGKIARKAERENMMLDPDRGGGCPWKQLTQKGKKIVRAERRREKWWDERKEKKQNNHKARRKTLKTEISTGRRYSAICAEGRMSEFKENDVFVVLLGLRRNHEVS